MSELAAPLRHVLEATGYYANGLPAAPTVARVEHSPIRREPSFEPQVRWRNTANLNVYFKYVPRHPPDEDVQAWQQEVWNQGSTPLLWVVCPTCVDVYNGFGLPRPADDVAKNRLKTFDHDESSLRNLDAFAGRLAMETGQFWGQERHVDRRSGVDSRLLASLAHLERGLVDDGLRVDDAQGLIGRSIFAKYLVDRGIVADDRPEELCDHGTLQEALRDRAATERLFDWLRETFNGDMFPPSVVPRAKHRERIARFFEGDAPDGQMSLFPYRFDVIPSELISAVYEQFVHSASRSLDDGVAAASTDVYYTPLAAVSLVLDEIAEGLTGHETVLDLTCGSGVFLVEALRRLVELKCRDGVSIREAVAQTLYSQVFGMDLSDAAIRVASFSLYLAALELAPDLRPFKPLVDKTLFVGDARKIETTRNRRTALTPDGACRKFDVIVGNPPWSFQGRAGTAGRRETMADTPRSPRGRSLDFVEAARLFAHDRTRLGMILSATPFFSHTKGRDAAQRLVESLSPVTLVDLSQHASWLFPRANMPAMALLARGRLRDKKKMTLVQAPWSLSGGRSHTLDIAPGDVATLHIGSWKRHPALFKATFFGRLHDLLLLDDLAEKQKPLEDRLAAIESGIERGLTSGNTSRDATSLRGLPLLENQHLGRFDVPADLPEFGDVRAERPRERSIYRAPLVILHGSMHSSPRPIVAVSERDVVFTQAYFGASLQNKHADVALLVAGILSSAVASWYFIMAASSFGLRKRRLLLSDVRSMPAPDLERAAGTDAGRRVVRMTRAFHGRTATEKDLAALDDAVCDVYELRQAERWVVRDGLFRASWQWDEERHKAVRHADVAQLRQYAETFVSAFDSWLRAANERRLHAYVYEGTDLEPVRVVRFVLENHAPPSTLEFVRPHDSLRHELAAIGERLNVAIAEKLVGSGELEIIAVPLTLRKTGLERPVWYDCVLRKTNRNTGKPSPWHTTVPYSRSCPNWCRDMSSRGLRRSTGRGGWRAA